MKPFALTLAAIALTALPAAPAAAGPLGTTIPSNCVRHTTFSGGADAQGDYRCAGIAIEYHTAGVANSPFPIWAGQWLFVDQTGQYRVGTCTLNRGVHPTILSPSSPVPQTLPNDPGGARTAYLTWKYGDTRDNLTAAALWAVFHWYAQDAAGSNRAGSATSPLVPRLDGLAADSGRADLQAKAIALHDEATRFAGAWALTVALQPDGTATATLLAGSTPVPDQQISVLVSGSDAAITATTGTDGRTTVTVPLLPSGTVTVVATAQSPGAAIAYRGAPASPDPQGAQILVTGGAPTVLRAQAQLEVVAPTTTAAPTTTVAPTTTTTTLPATTTTLVRPLATTTTEAPTTTVAQLAPSTTTPETTTPETTTIEPTTTEPTTTVAVVTTELPPTTASRPPGPLPRTGGGGDGWVAYFATALLVGGVGLLGTIRRRGQLAYTAAGDTG